MVPGSAHLPTLVSRRAAVRGPFARPHRWTDRSSPALSLRSQGGRLYGGAALRSIAGCAPLAVSTANGRPPWLVGLPRRFRGRDARKASPGSLGDQDPRFGHGRRRAPAWTAALPAMGPSSGRSRRRREPAVEGP